MNTLILSVAALLCCAPAHAKDAGTLFSEPEEGLFILRQPDLSEALRDSDRVCAAYAKAQDEADLAVQAAAATPSKRHLREKTGKLLSAHKLMGACLEADRAAKKKLAEVIGDGALDRLQKAAAFEDMVYIQLVPDSDPGRPTAAK